MQKTMRLKCQIEVVNRSVASQGLRGGCGKYAQSTLFLAKKTGDIVYLVYCTIKDRDGVKYKIHNNIEKIFAKFLSEGKATIRMKQPEVDLCINKANPTDLKKILNALKMAHCGQNLSGHFILSSMEPPKKKHVQAPPTKMRILTRKDYPLTASFPISLKELKVCDCKLARFDSRMFALKNLTSLDLSSNKIKVLPSQLADMESLHSLILSDNEICEFPSALCLPQSKLCMNLKVLSLNDNHLSILPKNFCNLRVLRDVCLGNNGLKALPREIGQLTELRRLHAPRNSLKMLPYSILKIRTLEDIDLFLNPFVTSVNMSASAPASTHSIPSLQELAAKMLRQIKISYESQLPYRLNEYLSSGVQCPCLNYCFGAFKRAWINFDLRTVFSNVSSLDTASRYNLIVEVPLCSDICKL